MTSRQAVLRRCLGTVAAGCLVWGLASCGGEGGALPPLDEDYPPEMLRLGGEVYDDTCSQCHGRNGKGNVGPSLVGIGDRMTFDEQVAIIEDGKGQMPAMSGTLTQEEIDAVAAFERITFR